MSTTGISYSGRVVLTKYKNGKKIGTRIMHNNGTFLLFRYLCRCLSRTNTVYEDEKPFSIDLCYYDTNQELVSLLVVGNKPIWNDSSIQYMSDDGDTSCYVEYTFYIASGNINTSAVGSTEMPNNAKLVYVLRDRSGGSNQVDGSVLATVEDESFNAGALAISTNEMWVVKWRLTIQDAQGE